MADTRFTLNEIAGEYHDYSKYSHLIVRADGRFDWEAVYFYPFSDVEIPVAVSGRLIPDAGAFVVSLEDSDIHPPTDLFPPKLHAVVTPNLIFLLSDREVNSIINTINGGWSNRGWNRTIDASSFLHRKLPGATNNDANEIDPALLIPKIFANRILATPLHGKVLSIKETSITRVNMADPMEPPVWGMEHLFHLVADLGSKHGVFEGMDLYVGESRWLRGRVQRVMTDHCEMSLTWRDNFRDPKPKAGDLVFSSQVPVDINHPFTVPPRLLGKVLSVEEISQTRVNTAGSGQEPVWRTKHQSKLVVNLGSAHGLHKGIHLIVGNEGKHLRWGTVQQVMSDSCELHFEWFDDPPKIGDPVGL